ncbi:glycoside hydrolase superfamily [Hypoxylon argillaceum]|nr:glycoside hydrolase superfamily [Hypoxylon argillaceum]KAI1145266.1 glycoside hydrolase superfamily [Nemania diffusa]
MTDTGTEHIIQKELESHVKDAEPVSNTTPLTWRKRFVTRKRIIIVVTMVGIISLALGLGLGFGLTRACAAPRSSASIIQPAVGITWDYPLGFSLTASNANKSTIFYPVDFENTSTDTIAALKGAGHTIVCYFSAGSVEDYRADAGDFPAATIGNTLDGWPDEKWLDVRDTTVREIMATRISSAASKGCVGVDADNIDGYENDSGFDLTAADAVDYVRYLADTAHAVGLAYGLKNGGDLVDEVVDVAEWAINEECVEYDECADWAPFVQAGKPVFHVEYTDDDDATSVSAAKLAKACAADGQPGFSSIVKHSSLDNWVIYC